MSQIKVSKFLSYVLRHRPDSIGLTLDGNGWADVAELLACSQANGKRLTKELLQNVVAENDKKRFEFSGNGQKIRASQGHSLRVELAYQPKQPPAILYHGTVAKFLDAILEKGLIKMSRHHVHLSEDFATAQNVGSRRGKPLILTIRAREMYRLGHVFYLSTNGVWLTDHVPPAYLEWNKGASQTV